MTEQNVLVSMWQALLDDRKAERRKTYLKYGIFGGLALLYAVAFLAVQFNSKDSFDSSKPYVSMVRLSGAIGPGEPVNAATVNPLLERAFADSQAKGVMLVVNSPGGTPVQSSLIHDRIVELKKRHKKRVVVVGEDMLTSGAYLIAVAADEIVVNRSTLSGSIGVISRGFGFTGLMDKLGVERRVMTAGESKNMLDPFGPQTDDAIAKQAVLLQQIHTHFIDTVKAGRGERLKADTPGLFSGQVWTGEDAVRFGLVDKLGDVKSAAQETFSATAIKEFKPPQTLLDTVVNGIGAHVSQALSPKVSAAVELVP